MNEKRLTDELWPGGYKCYKDKEHFALGTDSVLLAAFAKVKRGMKAADLGTGGGYIPLMLLGWQREMSVDAVEIVPSAARLAKANVELNSFEDRVRVYNCDLRQTKGVLEWGTYDLVTCNPPYFDPARGALSASDNIRTARSTGCTVEDVCRAAASLLKTGGSLTLCWKPERLSELFAALAATGLEAKRMRLCQGTRDKDPYLVLVDARRQAKPGLVMMKPLVVRTAGGDYTEEVLGMYHLS
ncbi:MAG: methyltransferase [Oscillospiraceae bacterium]|nr:methyltransferase [Oscillospiraceae bacterium]